MPPRTTNWDWTGPSNTNDPNYEVMTPTTTRRPQWWCDEPNDNVKSLTMWRTRQQRAWHHSEPDNEAKNPTTWWAWRTSKEPNDNMVGPTTMWRAGRHGEPEFGAGPCPAPFFFNLFLVPLHQEGLSPPWNFFIFLQLLCDPLGTILNVVGQMDIWLYTR